MKPEEIRTLIAQAESVHLEFKTGSTLESIARVVCALLNGDGGRVLVGVGDKGKITGVDDPAVLLPRLEGEISKLISPSALWTIEPMQVGDKYILIIDVPQGLDKPYVTGGAIYFRRSGRILPATRDEISALIRKRSETSVRWERQIVVGANREDLEDSLVRETVRLAVESNRWQGSPDDTDAFLHSLGLIADRGVTSAAVLVFGKQPSRFLPQARVRLIVMPEGKTGNRYSSDKIFEGALIRLVDQIIEALTPYTSGVESRFSDEDWRRKDRPLYPLSALREGVMNALVHRDYELSGSITILVLPGSLKISNPGALPHELKPADLKRDHLSLPRNPDIAHVFFLSRLIDKVGRGTQRIMEDCRKARLRDPKWQTSNLETTLTLFAPTRAAAKGDMEELNERQQQILEVVRQRTRLRASEVFELVGRGVTDRTVRNDLRRLVEGGWLVQHGRGRSISYVLGPTGKAE